MTTKRKTRDGGLERPVCDVLAAPDGYGLDWAVFTTHDFDQAVVADHLVPALCGVLATDPARIRQMSRCLMSRPDDRQAVPGIVIFVGKTPFKAGASAPGCEVVAVGGRRLHAKCALVAFRDKRGGRLLRAVVMSANLTESGLTSNRELVVSDECSGRVTSGHLVGSVAGFLKTLAKEAGLGAELRSRLSGWLRSVPARPAPGMLVHSLGRKGIAEQFAPGFVGPASRMVIVSPPFASSGDAVADPALGSLIGPKTTVELYTGLDPDVGARFSSSAWRHLKGRAGSVRLFGVEPIQEDPDSGRQVSRALHAKMLAVVDGDGVPGKRRACLLVGSANYTTNGLAGGRNREAAVLIPLPEAGLDALLQQLKVVEFRGAPSDTDVAASETWEVAPALPFLATFRVGPGVRASQRCFAGTLTVTWQGEGRAPRVAWGYQGDAHPEIRLRQAVPFMLAEACWALEGDVAGRRFSVPITVDAPAGFWAGIEPERLEDPVDPAWMALLRDLTGGRGEPSATTVADPKGTGKTAAARDDRFCLPLDQRLVVLARHRARLAGRLDPEEGRKTLAELLQGEGPEAVECADALFGAYVAGGPVPADSLLQALVEALPACDALADEEDADAE